MEDISLIDQDEMPQDVLSLGMPYHVACLVELEQYGAEIDVSKDYIRSWREDRAERECVREVFEVLEGIYLDEKEAELNPLGIGTYLEQIPEEEVLGF